MVRNKYVGRRSSFVWLHGQSVQFLDGLHYFPIGHHCLGLCSRHSEDADQARKQTSLPFAVQGDRSLVRQLFFSLSPLEGGSLFQFRPQRLNDGLDRSAECASKRNAGVHKPSLSLSLWLENQNNKFAACILLGFKTLDLLVTKTLLGPPTPEVKAFPIDFQAGPFEKLIKQIQQSGKSQDNGSRQADRKAEKVNEGKKEAAQKKKDRKTNLPPTNWLDDCDVFWLPRFPMKRLGGAEGGKSMVSRILDALVRKITRRSIPKPIPPAGGIPCSSAEGNLRPIPAFLPPPAS